MMCHEHCDGCVFCLDLSLKWTIIIWQSQCPCFWHTSGPFWTSMRAVLDLTMAVFALRVLRFDSWAVLVYTKKILFLTHLRRWQKTAESSVSYFYRAMHFSAYARSWDRMSSVCPSVRPSVCNVGVSIVTQIVSNNMTEVLILVSKVHSRVAKSKAGFHSGHVTTRSNKNLWFTCIKDYVMTSSKTSAYIK